nr:hypothetical protein [Tanacetum cinerariifolium]
MVASDDLLDTLSVLYLTSTRLRKSKHKTHKLQASGSSEGADFKLEVPDEPTAKTKDTSEGTSLKPGVLDVSKEDSSDSDDDSGVTVKMKVMGSMTKTIKMMTMDKSDDEEKMYKEEDDDVVKELYGDLNFTQGLRDTDITNVEQGGADQQNASHESGFVHEEEDAHVTLTTVHDKTEGPLQSTFVSADFTSKLLNLDEPSPDINSLIDTSTVPLPPLLVNPSSHLTTIPQQQTPDSTTKTTNPMMYLP